MLVRITDCCRMGCTHCMVEAHPDGEHMAMENFAKSIDLAKRIDLPVLMISGGEPLEHPEFFEFAKLAKKNIKLVLLLTNGMFAEDEELTKRVLDLDLMIQITNDQRFYPKRVPKIIHPSVSYETHIRMITPLGRASEMLSTKQAPMCYNLRSVVRAKKNLQAGILLLRSLEKFCSPSINTDGSIVAGESSLCHKIGTVDSSDQELAEALMHMQCNRCGLEDKLSQPHREAIGL